MVMVTVRLGRALANWGTPPTLFGGGVCKPLKARGLWVGLKLGVWKRLKAMDLREGVGDDATRLLGARKGADAGHGDAEAQDERVNGGFMAVVSSGLLRPACGRRCARARRRLRLRLWPLWGRRKQFLGNPRRSWWR